jgi:betaine-aldehyde dehydrogenase|tara:strand:+ start:1042 stop:2484 length:1443 start_codon:yes stop_codon:yes gene_type:complete
VDQNLFKVKGTYVNGKWFNESKTYEVINPSNNTVLANIPISSPEELELAVQSAATAQKEWAKVDIKKRADLILQLCSRIEDRVEEFALMDTYNAGNAITFARKDVLQAVDNMKYFAGLVREVKGETFSMEPKHLNFSRQQPYGIVLKINSFNRPFRWCAEKLAAPILMGNAVIIKNSEQAPISSLKFCELLYGLFPDGLINVVTGGADSGSFLVKHPLIKRIAVISSVQTGVAIAKDAAPLLKNISLELGGKNPLIVFEDADIDFAVDLTIKGMRFDTKGESCSSPSRILVHKKLHDKYLETLIAEVKKIPVGLPWIDTNVVGPVVSKKQFESVNAFIQSGIAEGAKLELGGNSPTSTELKDGFFINPTIFSKVTPAMKIANEEIFGPVISVMSWDSYDEMMSIANSTAYGLTAGIVTNSLSDAMKTAEEIQCGYVWINAAGRYAGAPYGGWKLSGLGVEECFDELKSYTKTKNINMKWL